VSIDDVVWGLLAALFHTGSGSRVFEIPGPERVSHRDVLQRVAAVLGHKRPMLSVPVLSPRLSSYWIALVTRVDLELAKELVEGVRYDLDPQEDVLWERGSRTPILLEAAAQNALDEEQSSASPPVEAAKRMREIGNEFKARDL